MVKLRLQRFGSHKNPFYRIVACDSHSPRDGKFIEIVGTYDPKTEPATVNIKKEVAVKWLDNGAQPTETVRNLFKAQGIAKTTKTL